MENQAIQLEKLKKLEESLINDKWLPVINKRFSEVKYPTFRQIILINSEIMDEINSRIKILSNSALCAFFHLFNEININYGGVSHSTKAKLVLYQLITGINNYDMPVLSEPTLRRMQKTIWKDNWSKIDSWANEWMKILSTSRIRALYATIYNPPTFKSVTMFIDGKDFVTILSDLSNEKKRTKNGKSNLISRKNNFKNAGKIVFLDDIKLNPLALSEMVGANAAYDGHLMIKMELHKIMDPQLDCLMFDHHFDSSIQTLIEDSVINSASTVAPLQECNFCYNIRKKKNVSLLPDELDYQEKHGGFRSKQETERNAALVHTFKRFSSKCSIRTTSFKILQLQIKVACVLLAISREEKRHPVLFNDIEFSVDSFEYPIEEDDCNVQQSTSVKELIEQQVIMSQKQQQELKRLLDDEDEVEQREVGEENSLLFIPVEEDTYNIPSK